MNPEINIDPRYNLSYIRHYHDFDSQRSFDTYINHVLLMFNTEKPENISKVTEFSIVQNLSRGTHGKNGRFNGINYCTKNVKNLISKSPYIAYRVLLYNYLDSPEGEDLLLDSIAKCSSISTLYADRILLGKRFPRGEPAIMKNEFNRTKYLEMLQKNKV